MAIILSILCWSVVGSTHALGWDHSLRSYVVSVQDLRMIAPGPSRATTLSTYRLLRRRDEENPSSQNHLFQSCINKASILHDAVPHFCGGNYGWLPQYWVIDSLDAQHNRLFLRHHLRTITIWTMVLARYVEVNDTFVGKLQLSTAPLLFQTGMFGMHTLLMFLSVYILSRKGISASRRTMLLILILVIYASSTVHWALATSAFDKLIRDPTGAPGPSPAATITSVTLIGINVTLSDVIVLWRAHVLCGRGRVVLLISSALLVSTPTCLLVNVIILVKTTLSKESLAQTAGDTVIGALGVLSSCLTNIWATSLVIFRTVKYRRDFVKFLRDHGPGRNERVLMLLVESGVLYCMFWIALLAMAWSGLNNAQTEDVTSPSLVAQSSIFASMAQLCGIYPTLVIVAVCLQGAAYRPEILTGQLPGLDTQNGHISTQLEFARARTQATMQRRSDTVSVGLPPFSSDLDMDLEQDSHDHQRLGEADKKSVPSVPW
ncbi:unnamed protein product [Peniophora sp. CBMAI 1063]|nr:unnamed protein product [Peniophora sp. CBMAI 1063]